MKKKKVLKLVALVLALVLLGGLGWFANGLVGNPISRWLADRAVDCYIAEHYSHLDLYTKRFGFDFKSGGYFAYVCSETSMDTAFYIDTDMLGHVTYDSFDTWVTSKYNTELRVQEQYRELVKSVLNSAAFSYVSDIKGGELEFQRDWEWGDDHDHSHALPKEELVKDKEYSMKEILDMGSRAGILTVYVQEDNVTPQRAAEIILHIRSLFDDAGITFYRMDFVLQYPKPEDGTPWPKGDVRADILCRDIREEGLVQRIQESHDAIYAYFAELDKEKALEIGSND